MMDDEESYDSSDPKDVNKRKKAESNAEKLQVSDLKFLMKQPQFRRFIWNFLTFTKIFEVSDPHAEVRATGFFDGQRNVGLKHFADIQENCPDMYLEMVMESKKKGYTYDD